MAPRGLCLRRIPHATAVSNDHRQSEVRLIWRPPVPAFRPHGSAANHVPQHASHRPLYSRKHNPMAYFSWTDNSLVRYFPTSPSRKRKPLRLDAARGEFISFQTLIHHDEKNPVAYAVTVNTPGGSRPVSAVSTTFPWNITQPIPLSLNLMASGSFRAWFRIPFLMNGMGCSASAKRIHFTSNARWRVQHGPAPSRPWHSRRPTFRAGHAIAIAVGNGADCRNASWIQHTPRTG